MMIKQLNRTPICYLFMDRMVVILELYQRRSSERDSRPDHTLCRPAQIHKHDDNHVGDAWVVVNDIWPAAT